MIIQPIIPETSMAIRIAIGPNTAASWVSSDMLDHELEHCSSRWLEFLLRGAIIICHCPRYRNETTISLSIDRSANEVKMYPSKKENPLLPHPEPSVMLVNTQAGSCFSGVRYSSAIQIPMDPRTRINLVSHQSCR